MLMRTKVSAMLIACIYEALTDLCEDQYEDDDEQ